MLKCLLEKLEMDQIKAVFLTSEEQTIIRNPFEEYKHRPIITVLSIILFHGDKVNQIREPPLLTSGYAVQNCYITSTLDSLNQLRFDLTQVISILTLVFA